MTGFDQGTILEIVVFIAIPAVAGFLLTKWAGDAAKRRGWDPPRVRGIRILLTVLSVAAVAIGASVTFGSIGLLSTLTVSAIAGIGVTLALQTTLQNIVAGYILLHRRFLRLGDQVVIGGIEGQVVSVDLITTVVKVADGSLAFVSNSNMLGGPLVNRTAAKRLAGEY